jgi:hypothetical protein
MVIANQPNVPYGFIRSRSNKGKSSAEIWEAKK